MVEMHLWFIIIMFYGQGVIVSSVIVSQAIITQQTLFRCFNLFFFSPLLHLIWGKNKDYHLINLLQATTALTW